LASAAADRIGNRALAQYTSPPLDAALFIPGFFGFGAFGRPGHPLVEYFARVEQALLATHQLELRLSVHQPPPTGSLAERVRSLRDEVAKVASEIDGRVHLLGHSTGGIDARLFANPRYTAAGPRDELLARLGSIVTLSAPFHGTPLARKLLLGAGLALPALYFASILASRRRLQLAGQAGALFNFAKRLALQQPTPTDQLIAQLAAVDDETADQIRRFLRDVADDHPLVADLTPESMTALNRELSGHDFPRLHSFVTVAPAPGWGMRDAVAFAKAPTQRLLYDAAHALSSGRPPLHVRLPEGPWLGHGRIPIDDGTSDGIVPAWSQTLDGRADGIVLGDHLDVIGHYEAAGATFLSSGSRFDDARFEALWAGVAQVLRRPPGDTSLDRTTRETPTA
jgi:hypothetical protein